MKQQFSCPALCICHGMPYLPWRPEDGACILRILVKPALVTVVIALLVATMLLGGRSLAPFVIDGGIGNPARFAMISELAAEERELQAEVDRLLANFEPSNPARLRSLDEHP